MSNDKKKTDDAKTQPFEPKVTELGTENQKRIDDQKRVDAAKPADASSTVSELRVDAAAENERRLANQMLHRSDEPKVYERPPVDPDAADVDQVRNVIPASDAGGSAKDKLIAKLQREIDSLKSGEVSDDQLDDSQTFVNEKGERIDLKYKGTKTYVLGADWYHDGIYDMKGQKVTVTDTKPGRTWKLVTKRLVEVDETEEVDVPVRRGARPSDRSI